jgi:DNA repair exonuclease SbcCD ATPase subunit
MTGAIGYVVKKLPNIYESKALLIVQPPKISSKVVTSMTDEDLTQRVQTINQEVLSDTELKPMITKYDLFKKERESGAPIESLVPLMLKNITVVVERSEDQTKVAAFSIKYRDRTPESARNVTSELASKYINAQVKFSSESAATTQEFVDKNLSEKKLALDELEKQRLQIMMQNVETLPESSQGLIAQLDGLRKREETISKEKETFRMEKSRLNDNIQSLNSQMRLVDQFSGSENEANNDTSRILLNSQPYAQLIQKRAELSSKLENLKLTLRDVHPKVMEAKNDIAKVNDEIENLKRNQVGILQESESEKKRKAELQKQTLLIEKNKAESQIANIDQQLKYKDDELARNSVLISGLESKINLIPNVSVALQGIDSQYQSAKTAYDEVLKTQNAVNLDYDRASNLQGETIKLQDPANLPDSPVAPKRGLLTAVGSVLGLVLGLFLAAVFELPRVLKIQNIEDTKHYSGLPVLASVPPLLTPQEKTWQVRTHWFKVIVGVAAAIGSIPLVIIFLQFTRIFDRLVS